jgi:hypothetical protein
MTTDGWPGITKETNKASLADLYLWLRGFTDGFCKISAEYGPASPAGRVTARTGAPSANGSQRNRGRRPDATARTTE